MTRDVRTQPEPNFTPEPVDSTGRPHDRARVVSGLNASITLGWKQHERFWRSELARLEGEGR